MNTDFLPVAPLDEHHVLDRFDSGVEDLDRWLRRTALTAASVGTAATYVLCHTVVETSPSRPVDAARSPVAPRPGDDGAPSESSSPDGDPMPLGPEVVGYYTLAVRSIEQDLGPRLLARGVPESVSVIQIARLAIDRNAQGVGLGGELLVEALRRAVIAGRSVGARAVVVDSVDEPAYRFYEHMGFEELEGMRLFKSLDDLEQALGAERPGPR